MSETDQSETTTENPIVILLDTHMIQHFLNKETAPHLVDTLKEIEEIGAVLGVSQIVVYESLKAIVFNEQKYKVVADFFEKYLVRYPVGEDVLFDAARVHELYGSDSNTKNRREGISTEDIIIGTTAMIQGAYVMTCDANDFPIPFFKEVDRKYVYYEVRNMRKHIVIYMLEPDAEAIEAGLYKANPPKVSKPVTKSTSKNK